MNTELIEKLSLLVQSQLPDFVKDNYPTFIAFIKAYYEFLEQDSEAQYAIQNARSYADIDNTIDDFVDKFLQQFAFDLPGSIFTDPETGDVFAIDEVDSKRAIAKKLSNYYSNKGSESAVRLLFRLLFNEEIVFYYPKEDILRTSDGRWTLKKSIKVTSTNEAIDLIPLSANLITGVTSGSTAVVDEIYKLGKEFGNVNVYELKLENSSIGGEFIGGERIRFSYGNIITGNANVLNVVSAIDIVDSGYGYSAGDQIVLNGSGALFSGKVSYVNDGGKIQEIEIVNFGSGYDTVSNVTINLPSAIKSGKFYLSSNIATAVLFDTSGNAINHGLQANDTINVNFTSGLSNTYNSNYTIIETPSTKKFKFSVANSSILSGNITLNSRQANLQANIGTLCDYVGFYEGTYGQPDSRKKIQDSYFYQEYSYQIESNRSSVYWKDIVKRALHPAGMELFSAVFVTTATDVVSVSARAVGGVLPVILQLLKVLSTSTPTKIVPISIENYVSIFKNPNDIVGRRRIGSSTYSTLEKFKFSYEDLQIKDVANITIESIQVLAESPIPFTPPNSVVLESV